MLVKAVLNMCPPPFATTSDSCLQNSYSTIDNVLTNLPPADLQDFFMCSILLIKSFRVQSFHCPDGNSFIILSAPIHFSASNAR